MAQLLPGLQRALTLPQRTEDFRRPDGLSVKTTLCVFFLCFWPSAHASSEVRSRDAVMLLQRRLFWIFFFSLSLGAGANPGRPPGCFKLGFLRMLTTLWRWRPSSQSLYQVTLLTKSRGGLFISHHFAKRGNVSEGSGPDCSSVVDCLMITAIYCHPCPLVDLAPLYLQNMKEIE